MSAFMAIYLREMTLLRRRLIKQISAATVAPLLYLLTFGYALGSGLDMDGRSYLEFLLPGLAAMSSMTQAFGMAGEINIARFYSGIFEEIQASPATRTAYALGEICAGLTRVFMGCGIIILLGLPFGVRIHCGLYFWLAVFLNGFAFSALAVALAMLIRSHADQGLLNTFVITPMAFLGGTFFPLDKLPDAVGAVLWCLPLSHAARAIRADAFGRPPEAAPFIVLAVFCAVFFALSVVMVGRARE